MKKKNVDKTGDPFWDSLRNGLRASAAVRDGKRPEELRLEDRVAELEAKLDVLGGEWCLRNRAEGRGGCGACAVCCQEARDRALAAEFEVARLRNHISALENRDEVKSES